MDLEAFGWTERMIVATLADYANGAVEPRERTTAQLYLGYWLQRHGLSGADREEVVDACNRLQGEGLLERVEGDEPADHGITWMLTGRGVEEAERLWSIFERALQG